MARPRILISNDDGIHAPGIQALAAAASAMGDVTVVAPDRERSGAGHAISLYHPLRLTPHGEGRWAVDGTPTDAVYVGIHHVFRDGPPDLMLSGVNRGANLANDVTYSGTVSAAFEACLFGIPAVAISLTGGKPWDFEHAASVGVEVGRQVLAEGLPRGTLLNVNVPPGAPTDYRVTRLGRRSYGQAVDERRDPRGGRYYWIGGTEQDHDDIPGSDCNAVFDEGLISITPLHLDLSYDPLMAPLKGWRLEGLSQDTGDDA